MFSLKLLQYEGSTIQVMVILFVFSVLYSLASRIYTAHSKLRSIPGPPVAAYTRLWMVLALYYEECAAWYLETNEKYGTPIASRYH